ncbi:MAG TPA: site-specific integrase [Candidatus Eremiobacteraceae bacterium]|nr:site-specific integrase [Candidatus Eremiobacteraceae bacterium]
MGELVALSWKRVDTDNGTIRIAYGQAKDRSLTEPKTSRSRRTIKLPPFAVSALKAYKAKQKLASEAPWSDDTFVFQDEFGRPIRVADISGDFRPIAKRAGLGEEVHPHTLRHTYASLALKAGVPITTVSANLGHNNTTTTMGVYGHHIPATEDAAAVAIQRAIGGDK